MPDPVVHVAYRDAEAYANGEEIADESLTGVRSARRPRRRRVRLERSQGPFLTQLSCYSGMRH
jgi:hypothetical protein